MSNELPWIRLEILRQQPANSRCRIASLQLTPVRLMELDFVLPGRCHDALPCLITFGICNTLDVSETGNRITDVGSVVNGLLALFRKGKALILEMLTAPWVYF